MKHRGEHAGHGMADGWLAELMKPGHMELAIEVSAAAVVAALPHLGVHWTWPLVVLGAAGPVWLVDPVAGAVVMGAALLATAIAWRSHQNLRRAGGDIAARLAARGAS